MVVNEESLNEKDILEAESLRETGKTNYVIGIDCGTLSARAVVVRVLDGSVAAGFDMEYPHGIITERLPNGIGLSEGTILSMAEDYLTVLPLIVRGALEEAAVTPEQVIGIGIDATSCTIVPCMKDGTPLALAEKYQERPHAYIKLWKHHNVKKQAKKVEELAEARNEGFLSCNGNVVSCELILPKIMQIYEEDPALFEETSYYVDLCDWLTWRLTGVLKRSANSAGFKGLWSLEKGYPDKEFLDELYDGFGSAYYDKAASGPVVLTGECCGYLGSEAAEWLGLSEGVAVASGMMDGHASVIALGMQKSGEMALIVGTSNAIPFLADRAVKVKGIFGMVQDGIIPGVYGYSAGQIATGDMLAWFVKNQVPASYKEEADERGISVHKLLCEKAEESRPEKNTLTILDWWHGNRSILCNEQLTGIIKGNTLETRPEEIYCAKLHGIACGTRVIIEQSYCKIVDITRIFACGGIPCKNPFFMQQYANILNRTIWVANVSNSPALGSAICAAAAVSKERGGYGNLARAMEKMHIHDMIEYTPQLEYVADYEKIYERYYRLYDVMGKLEE